MQVTLKTIRPGERSITSTTTLEQAIMLMHHLKDDVWATLRRADNDRHIWTGKASHLTTEAVRKLWDLEREAAAQ